MDFKKFIIENHPDPDSVFGIDKYDFEQIVILAENFAKKEVEAINYTHCCESDSEQLKDEEIPKIDDWIKDLGYKQVTFSFVYKNGGTYKDREQLCKEYKKEFCL